MPLSGIEIYKFLPKTNCKKCGFPTCLAFAMRVAQQTVDIAASPDLSAEGRQALEAAGRPPIQLVTIGKNERHIEVGNETVLYRHEKTFYHQPGLMLRLTDTTPGEELRRKMAEVDSYKVDRVGRVLALDGFALDNRSGDAEVFTHCVDMA
ncbi:MAG: (Fe-S)-binding protein, partial [Chloroflexota bacterium]